MPDIASTIIVSGGINAGSPFLAGFIPVITQVSPPLVADSIMQQLTDALALDGAVILVGASDVGNVAHEELRTTGGFISEKRGFPDSLIMGRLATVASGGAIAIGKSATTTGTSDPVVVGTSSSSSAIAGVALGQGATAAGNSSLSAIAIGFNATTATAHNGAVAIGDSALSDSGVAIGSGCRDTAGGHRNVLIGAAASTTGAFTDVILIGGSDQTSGNANRGQANGQILLGLNIEGITNAGAVVIQGDASQTDLGANAWQFGSRTYQMTLLCLGQGDLVAATNPGPALTIRQTNAQGLNQNGGSLTIIASRSTGTGVGGGIIFQTGVTGGSGSVLNVAATALTIADGTQIATFTKRVNLTETAATGAVALTLTNGPGTATAGPPQAYARIQIAGTNYVIPCWTA